MEKTFQLKEENPFNTPEGRQWAIDMLKMGPARVTFIKSDGTERVMNCTLKEDLVPLTENKTDRKKTPNEAVLPVYDLDVKGWRSFRLDSVKTFSFDL